MKNGAAINSFTNPYNKIGIILETDVFLNMKEIAEAVEFFNCLPMRFDYEVFIRDDKQSQVYSEFKISHVTNHVIHVSDNKPSKKHILQRKELLSGVY